MNETGARTTRVTAPRVAVIDDEPGIRDVLTIGLDQAGFAVRTASDAGEAVALVREWRPEAIVLDVMLPKMDGLSLMPVLRRYSESPILVLSALGDVGDRVHGLIRGADDYLAKPFDLDELAARLQALLRRPLLRAPQTLSYADLHVDLDTRSVHRGERRVHLTSREYDVLCVLLRRPERVFTRDELLDAVWADRDVLPGSVETYVSYVRAKIDGEGDVPLITTIRGAGYTIRTGS